MEHAVVTKLGSLTLRLPRAGDLILMKAVAGRPRDLEDIESIIRAHPATDLTETRGVLLEFATALGSGALVTGFDNVVMRTREAR